MMVKSLKKIIAKTVFAVLLHSAITELGSQSSVNLVSAEDYQLGLFNVDFNENDIRSDNIARDELLLEEAIDDIDTLDDSLIEDQALVNAADIVSGVSTADKPKKNKGSFWSKFLPGGKKSHDHSSSQGGEEDDVTIPPWLFFDGEHSANDGEAEQKAESDRLKTEKQAADAERKSTAKLHKAVRNIGRAADIKLKNEEKEHKKNIQSLKSHQRDSFLESHPDNFLKSHPWKSFWSKFQKGGRLSQNKKDGRSAKNIDQIEYLSQLDSEVHSLSLLLPVSGKDPAKSVAKLFSVSDEIRKHFHYLFNPSKTLSDRKINEIQKHVNSLSAEIPVQKAIRTQLEQKKNSINHLLKRPETELINHLLEKKPDQQPSKLIEELENLLQFSDKLLSQKAITALGFFRFISQMKPYRILLEEQQ